MPDLEYVTLVTGEVVKLFESDARLNYWHWEIDGDEDAPSGTTYGRDCALRISAEASARRMMKPVAVLGFTLKDALALERADRSVYTKALKRLMVQSTREPASSFQVKGGSGTASCWVDVRGTTERGRLWCASLFGSSDESIPPTRGYRAWYAASAAGICTDGIELSEHGWD